MTRPKVNLDSIQRAAAQLRGKVQQTPLRHSKRLSEATGAELYLKLENQQSTGAFKERGALVKLLSLSSAERARGVIAMSAGNHAQAVAHHASLLGVRAQIVMPKVTPAAKINRTRSLGAEVTLHGRNLAEATRHAQHLAKEHDHILIHPYDDPQIISGQGTVALEMLEAEPQLDCLVVPVGGGGLIAGMAVAAKALRPKIEIIGVQSEAFPAMIQHLAHEPIRCASQTIAEGIAVAEPGKLTTSLIQTCVDAVLPIEEAQIEQAIVTLLEVEKTVVEGAGAAGLAYLLQHPERFKHKRVGLVLSGGNLDLRILGSIIERSLVRMGRLARLQVDVSDLPGGLAALTSLLGEKNANIVEVHHQRAFTDLPLQTVQVEVVVECRTLAHAQAVTEHLRASGFPTRWSSEDR